MLGLTTHPRVARTVAILLFSALIAGRSAPAAADSPDTYAPSASASIAAWSTMLTKSLHYILHCWFNPDASSSSECADPIYFGKTSGLGSSTRGTAWDAVFSAPIAPNLRVGIVGGVGQYKFNFDRFDSHISSDAMSGGAFAAYNFAPNLLLSVLGIYSDTNSKMNSYGTAAWYHSRQVMLQAEVTRFIRIDKSHWADVTGGVSYARDRREAFTDTLFGETEPGSATSMTRLRAGARLGKNFAAHNSACSGTTKPACADATAFIGFAAYHDSVSGNFSDPIAGFPAVKTHYFGILGLAGFEYPLNRYVSVGGQASAFSGGNFSGYSLAGVLNVKLWELAIGRAAPLIGR